MKDINLGENSARNFKREQEQQKEQQNKGLKCCGNCRWYYPCTYDSDSCSYHGASIQGDDLCDNWTTLEEE